MTDLNSNSGDPAGNGDDGQQQAPSKVTFTTEQQSAIDKLVAERLKRAEDKWKSDLEAKQKAEKDVAEKKRLEDEAKWQELAQKHQGTAAELEAKFGSASAALERANTVISAQVEAKKVGLPESLVRLLEGKDIYDQWEIINAFLEATPPPSNEDDDPPPAKKPTTPTPPAQGSKAANYVKEAIERQQKRATANDPYAAMMKK